MAVGNVEGWKREAGEGRGGGDEGVSLLITAQESLQDYTNPLSVGALMKDRSISLSEHPRLSAFLLFEFLVGSNRFSRMGEARGESWTAIS